jgi:hypothetical protein
MDEILRDDYFGFGNSDDHTKPADNESGVAPPKPGVAGFTIPIRIGLSKSNAVQQQIHQLIMTKFDGFIQRLSSVLQLDGGPLVMWKALVQDYL